MTEIREVLRLWVRGEGLRSIERLVSLDRKTVRRYVRAGQAAGLVRDGGETQLTDELLGAVVEAVRPARPHGRGGAWRRCEANRDLIRGWLDDAVPAVKIVELLARRGVEVPERTLHRFCAEVLGHGRARSTVRVADGDPGGELQTDYGRMGMIADPAAGHRRWLWALIFTAVVSRHMFVWLSHRQTTADVIAGCDAAWGFFGGVFHVLIPDNMSAVVAAADATAPRFTDAFYDYAQSRGFVIDPARVATPTDKPRVERAVQYVRGNFFAGEVFGDRDDAQRRVERWCRDSAGMRLHRTIQARPAQVFAMVEQPALLPAPTAPYDLPIYRRSKVARDHHIEVARSLYSVPGGLIGSCVDVRADSTLVRISQRGQLVKVHPRVPAGKRSTDPDDLPDTTAVYALRDIQTLIANAARNGDAVGAYATALLDSPLPWTRMRQVYRLIGLAKKWGPDRVDGACRRALDAEAVDVGLIARMLERATETAQTDPAPSASRAVAAGRFARDPDEFAVTRPTNTGSDGASGNGNVGSGSGQPPAPAVSIVRLRAAYFALCAHVRDVHGVDPGMGTAGQVEARHQAAHAREGTAWHSDAWRLPDPDEETP